MKTISTLFQAPPESSGKLHELAQSVETFQLLTSALQVGFFDSLEIPKPADALSEELGLNRTLTKKCCDALAGSGFLKRIGETYALSTLSETYLLKRSPYYQGDLISLLKKTRIGRWERLSEALRDGPIGSGQARMAVFDERFIHAMAQGAIRGDLQQTVEILGRQKEFMDARMLLDLGGGHALYSIAFTGLNPDLKACVFDLPPVIEKVTKKKIALYQADRITAVPGDFTQDDLSGRFDVVFASDVLYLSRDSLVPLLGRIRKCLKEDGFLISKHWHINDPVKNSTAVYFDLMFSITEEAERLYSTRDFSDILESSGFSVEEVHDLNSPSSSQIIIARKVKP
ncbi:methyltransferase [Methanosarcina sp. Mfa9]|uniref:methyltransferase n=1 Tax=Methanosarcina sp. Mfa9 TaxID=3439063 RepID=UPI003F852E29